MNLLGHDERERILAAAWDEVSTPTPLPGYPAIVLRPFSVNALRRGATMGLRCLAGDFRSTLAKLSPSVALGEVEALAWLLSEDIDAVRAAMRHQRWSAALEAYELPRGAVGAMKTEMGRVLDLLQATSFSSEKKPDTSAATRSSEEPEPPAHLIEPGAVATLAYALVERVGRPVEDLLEWVPACQIFQLAHCLQAGNSQIWTVDPARIPHTDPDVGVVMPDADPGFGEEIAF